MLLEPRRKFLGDRSMAYELRANRAAGLDQMGGQAWEEE